MASVNSMSLVGTLGADPVIRYLPDGTPTATLSVATTDKWRDKASGEVREKTEWHRVVFFKALAEIATQFLKKGSQIYVLGALRTHKWVDSDNLTRYTTEIVGRDLQMLGKKPAGEVAEAPSEHCVSRTPDLDGDVPF